MDTKSLQVYRNFIVCKEVVNAYKGDTYIMGVETGINAQ